MAFLEVVVLHEDRAFIRGSAPFEIGEDSDFFIAEVAV